MADASFVSFDNMVESIKQNSVVAQTYVYNFMAGGKPKAPLSDSKNYDIVNSYYVQGIFNIITVKLSILFRKMPLNVSD